MKTLWDLGFENEDIMGSRVQRKWAAKMKTLWDLGCENEDIMGSRLGK